MWILCPQELNWSELLRLYTAYDQLEDAVLLTIEYVDALMGTYSGPDCPAFNLKVLDGIKCQLSDAYLTLESVIITSKLLKSSYVYYKISLLLDIFMSMVSYQNH